MRQSYSKTKVGRFLRHGVHLNHDATLRCDISLTIVHVSGFSAFSDINISQDSVSTRLGFGRMFYYRFARNLLLSLRVKEF